MAKKNENQIVWIILAGVAIVAFIYLAQHGYFQSQFINENPFTPPPGDFEGQGGDKKENPGYTVSFSINPENICVGDMTLGTISSNINSGVCSIFLKPAAGTWTLFGNVNLDASGDYTANSPPVMAAGTASGIAICCDAAGSCKVSNQVTLTSRVCDSDGDGVPDETDPDDDNDGYSDEEELEAGTDPKDPLDHPTEEEEEDEGDGIDCVGLCGSLGFINGRPGAADWTCVGTEVWHLFGSAGCCCLPAGGEDGGSGDGTDYGGYPSCEAWKNAEGKEFYVTGVGITSLAGCEAYAQSYCYQFGSEEPHVPGGIPPGYVTMLDFDTPDCCIWNCNWGWD